MTAGETAQRKENNTMMKFSEFIEMAERLDNLGSPTAKEGSEVLFEAAVRLEELRKVETNKTPLLPPGRSATVAKLAAALARAQGAMEAATKDHMTEPKDGSRVKWKYADLAGVWEVCRKPLSENGLAVVQTPEDQKPDSLTIVTDLIHGESGEWIQSRLNIRIDPQGKSWIHSLGSAITYARRYALCAMLGIAAEDDDGVAASAAQEQRSEDRSGMSPTMRAKLKMLDELAKRAKALDGPPVMRFGPNKDKPIVEVLTAALERDLEDGRARCIASPSEKWVPELAAHLQQIEAELNRREQEQKKREAAPSKTDK